jgi:hypothetical protein
MILIISHEKDGHSRKVMDILDKKGHAYELLDLSCFPAEAALSISFERDKYNFSILERQNKVLTMGNFGSVWWRRPQSFQLHKEMNGPVESSFSFGECHCAINGLWLLEPSHWINNPVKDEVASRKVYQLRVAVDCGLTIPQTLISNSPEKAKEFIEKLKIGNVIYKSFSATNEAWRETRLVKKEELQNLYAVKYAPVIFQEYIEADIDLRITVIGDKIFPAAIYSQATSYKVDFRMNYHEARIEEHPLPPAIVDKLMLLMKKLGLVYGAIDMRKNNKGEYIFLEINTAGQWLFMEEPTGMPISKTLAAKLIEMDKKEVLQPA